jgi:hypothetical protein
LGHDVIAVTQDQYSEVKVERFPVGIHHVLSALPGGWEPDLVVLGDGSSYPMFLGLEFLQIPLMWYAIDSHIHVGWHRAYAAVFDVILVAQKSYVSSYQHDPSRQIVQWLPLFCQPEHDRLIPGPKIHDLCFVGTLNQRFNPDRVRLIEAIRTRFPIHTATGDYVETFNRSRVVLNQCVANDVNFRTFQAMACGSLLLMESVGNGLSELFQDRVHLVLYEKGNVDQIVDLTRHYVEHGDDRETIAAEGRKVVLNAHTSLHRAQTALDLVAKAEVNRSVSQRSFKLLEVQAHLSLVYEEAAACYAEAACRHEIGSPTRHRMNWVRDTFSTLNEAIRTNLGSLQSRGAR